MLVWSKAFETKIDVVDIQHKHIFDLVNNLNIKINNRTITLEDIDNSVRLLIHHTKTNFSREELLMNEFSVDKCHISKHIMEHKSFIYDLDRLTEITDSVDRRITGKAVKLVRFITFWLTFHILGTDLAMSAQIANIRLGMDTKKAYELLKDQKYDASTVFMMMDSIYSLWLDAKDRCNLLEKKYGGLE
jgi:hemerythrin